MRLTRGARHAKYSKKIERRDRCLAKDIYDALAVSGLSNVTFSSTWATNTVRSHTQQGLYDTNAPGQDACLT